MLAGLKPGVLYSKHADLFLLFICLEFEGLYN
jgi:hypothetical protein